MKLNSKIFISGYSTIYGKSLEYVLKKNRYTKIFLDKKINQNYNKLRLFFKKNKPEYVFCLGGESGGIMKNILNSTDLLINNLDYPINVIKLSLEFKVKKLIFLGSSCCYPANQSGPIKENKLLKGSIEPTNKPYAIAKIAGMTLCESIYKQYNKKFITAIPSNPYGPYDDFSESGSHVVAALIRKFFESKNNNKKVIVWGNGRAVRDFIYLDDVSEALILIMKKYKNLEPINISAKPAINIKTLARTIARLIKFNGKIFFDKNKPNGMKYKVLDFNKLRCLGWKNKTNLNNGLLKTYLWYLKNHKN
jgi:GDP-L-fucose synthase